MTNKQVEKILTKAVKDTIKLGNSAFPNYQIDFDKIEIRFTLRGTTGGRAGIHNGHLTVWLHPELAKRDIDDYIQQVIKHEIAHLYQRKMYPRSQPHGRQFKYICRQLGDSGKRTHNLNTKGLKQERKLTRYIYECPQCGREYGFTNAKHKKQNSYIKYDRTGNSGYICNRCGIRLKFTGLVREHSNITGKIMREYSY
jgi:SprT protein